MDKDFNENIGFNPYGATPIFETNDMYRDPMLNPALQYEQAYCYYKYLCMQMEYKIKCKEYEKMCQTKNST